MRSARIPAYPGTWTCVALLLLTPTLALAQPIASGTAATLARARDLIDRGAPRDAVPLLEPLARDVTSPRARAQADYLLAEVHERAFEFADALASYRASLAVDPGGRYAARCSSRIEYLTERSEGAFAPLAALERVRLDPVTATDGHAIDALLRAARTFPPGLVRTEARLVVAEAYAGRLDRPGEAVPVLREIAADPATSLASRRMVVGLLSRAHERTGDLDAALAEQIEFDGDRETIAQLRRLRRRRQLSRVSLVTMALVLVAGVVAVVRAVRRGVMKRVLAGWTRFIPIAHLAMLSIGGALLTHTYDEHGMEPFFAFGAGALVMYLVAVAWSVVGSPRTIARVGRAVVCAIAVLAVSFWAMYRYDPRMLEGIGL